MPTRRDFVRTCLASAAVLAQPSLYAMQTANATPNASFVMDEYFRRMAKWCPVIAKRLHDEPLATLATLEAKHGWYHLPYNVLSAAVLYKRRHASNPLFGKKEMLQLALDLGDMMVREDQQGRFAPRLDSYRDVYMWLETYQLLKDELGPRRAKEWQQVMERNVSLLLPEIAVSRDAPAYTENFIASSPNHLAWWSATVLIAGLYLQKREWIALGGGILKRFATTEQNSDGYWGEHNPNAPTIGYNYLTTMSVGVYYEHTKDPDALKALRRATTFHGNFTYADGNAMELFNDRNRYWHINYWGQFAFSNFADGRGYCNLLVQHLPDEEIDLDMLGLLAMNALYYHEGPTETAPPQMQRYSHRLTAEAGARKQGPWMWSLSGIIDTPLPRSQWFLDRQSNFSLFHEKTGLIVDGALSKHQPELATFSETIDGALTSVAKGSRLVQSDSGDFLALAYNTFSAELEFPLPTPNEFTLQASISGRGPAQDAYLTLQLHLTPGEMLTTGAGRTIKIENKNFVLSTSDIGGHLDHHGWQLGLLEDATLSWPVFPYNPYRNGPETKLEHAVAQLRIPLQLKTDPKHWLQPNERKIQIKFRVS